MATSTSTRKRLVADRFRRIWQVVEEIAASPGHSRADLARKFHLSERQVQADLNIIRIDMRMPLVRRQGYRFSDDGPSASSGGFGLAEAQLLTMVLRLAVRDRSIPKEALVSMLQRLPSVFPSHVRPLVGRTVQSLMAPPSQGQQAFLALAEALVRGQWSRLHYQYGLSPVAVPEPVVKPSLLLPYLDEWYVLGECQHDGHERMLPLANVRAVTLADAGGRA